MPDACDLGESLDSETPSTVDPEVDAASPALAALDALPVKGRAPKTGYICEQFVQAWTDVDRNGCGTRTDILGATLTGITKRSASTLRIGPSIPHGFSPLGTLPLASQPVPLK